ncbi:unnamed protein product, partial [Didymodactylos carnosus]
SIACDVLSPYFAKKVVDDILKSGYYSLAYDATNRGNSKVFPFVVQYFSTKGVKQGLIEVIEYPGETVDELFQNACEVLKSNGLSIERLTALGADNTNVNFGANHSLYTLFQNVKPSLIKAKRIEALKSYFEFVELDYVVLLQHIKIRWLSLFNSIERLVKVFPAIGTYFLNLGEDCPTILNIFFTSDEAICTLYFLENVLFEMQRCALQVQHHRMTAVDVHRIITSIVNKLKKRVADKYYGHLARTTLKKMSKADAEKLDKSFENFINKILDYIHRYFDANANLYEKLSIFGNISIDLISWNDVEQCVQAIQIENINMDKLYDELYDIQSTYIELKKKSVSVHEQIQSFLGKDKQKIKNDMNQQEIDDDEMTTEEEEIDEPKRIYPDQLWAYLFYVHENQTPNLTQLVSFCFSIPISNGYCEGVFNQLKQTWTNTRHKMSPELISAELKIRLNSTNITCEQFYNSILSNTELLKTVRSQQKYKHKAKKLSID